MTYLFAPRNRHLLETFAWSNVLLALDYDGTLAPIVRSPGRAQLRASTRTLLRRASRLFPCVVISGRAQADVRGRLPGVVCRVIGNHGAEPAPHTAAMRRRVRQWLPPLEQRLSTLAGVIIEDKEFSVAIHYRRSPTPIKARRSILAAVGGLEGARVVGGKSVVNLLLRDAAHKGLALERERLRFACDAAIFVGDDETDEDAFQIDQPGRLLAIRVGHSRRSAAPYYIRDQSEIDRLLREVIAFRENGHARR